MQARRKLPRALRGGPRWRSIASPCLLVAGVCLTPICGASAEDWYVDVNHPNCATGTGKPTDPFCNISDAITVALAGDTIHIAPGTYFENPIIDKDLALLGSGQEVTSIDGSLGSPIRVMTIQGGASVQVDGLTIENGNVHSGSLGSAGLTVGSASSLLLTNSTVSGNTMPTRTGGVSLYATGRLTANNCTFSNNRGLIGGVENLGAMTLTNCTIEGNYGYGDGGIWSLSDLTMLNCRIEGNYGQGAGGIRAGDGVTMSNCTVSGNTALFIAGVLANGDVLLERCTVAGNLGGMVGGIHNFYYYVTIHNTIVAGNLPLDCYAKYPITSRGYNLIGDSTELRLTGVSKGNQLDVDPLFVDPAGGDFTLQSISPAVDAGDPALLLCATDPNGNSRVLDGSLDGVGVIDIGAFEFTNVRLDITGVPAVGEIMTVDVTGTPGLVAHLLIGMPATAPFLAPDLGCLFVDPFTWLKLSLGVMPASLSAAVDPIYAGQTFVFQARARQGGMGGPANLSNPVTLTFVP